MNDENTDLSGGVIKSEVNMKHIIVADFSPQFLLKHSGLKSALPINYFTFNTPSIASILDKENYDGYTNRTFVRVVLF